MRIIRLCKTHQIKW